MRVFRADIGLEILLVGFERFGRSAPHDVALRIFGFRRDSLQAVAGTGGHDEHFNVRVFLVEERNRAVVLIRVMRNINGHLTLDRRRIDRGFRSRFRGGFRNGFFRRRSLRWFRRGGGARAARKHGCKKHDYHQTDQKLFHTFLPDVVKIQDCGRNEALLLSKCAAA